MNLTAYQLGALKGSAITSITFLVGIGVGLYFLHRKHETEMDKLAKDTAINCLDFAAEHYEGVILRREKERDGVCSQEQVVNTTGDEFGLTADAMNSDIEADGREEALSKEIECRKEAFAAEVRRFEEIDAEAKELLKLMEQKLAAESDLIVAADACKETIEKSDT